MADDTDHTQYIAPRWQVEKDGDPPRRPVYYGVDGRKMSLLHFHEITQILRHNRMHGPDCSAIGPCDCWLSTDVGKWRE